MLGRLILASLATLSLCGTAFAGYDESRIRQADQQNLVTGRVGSPILFTVSGFTGDTIRTPFCSGTIEQLRTNRYVYDVVRHSSGLISLRFCSPPAQASWNGVQVEISHAGSFTDRDPISLR